MSTRDSQRERIYRAEHTIPGGWTNTLGPLEAAQETVDRITTSRWFRSRWRMGEIKVAPSRSRASAWWAYPAEIRLPPAGRNLPTILHEIAHLCGASALDGDVAAHGQEFAATSLLLTERYRGADAAEALREAYRRERVIFLDARGLVPVKPRYEVESNAARAARARASVQRPPLRAEAEVSARTIRRLASQGVFGEAGTKARTYALATARAMEREAPALPRR